MVFAQNATGETLSWLASKIKSAIIDYFHSHKERDQTVEELWRDWVEEALSEKLDLETRERVKLHFVAL